MLEKTLKEANDLEKEKEIAKKLRLKELSEADRK